MTIERRGQRARRTGSAVAVASCALMLLASCGGGEGKGDSEAKKSPSPSSSQQEKKPQESKSREDIAEEELLASYRRFWDEQEAAYAKASVAGTDLKTYAKASAFALTQTDLKAMASAGQIATGKVTVEPDVTSLNLDKKVPLARIRDCVDVSEWKLIDRKTKKEVPLPKERKTRYVNLVTAEKWGKTWVVLETKPQNTAC
ncbi:hypothetical protein RCO28_34340 [Streptomyces sp. LHD-70]|uniref:hypothetical protein n=1 Tax=Streptomyces sp. LHD-70 TaxID=3072140 RepID=UPI00280FC155|nr:hypothetical protein [Streptomyces sp. LHD-70]MDQ8707512.1 hypothetical protein [Streptomyces sp. LHD-70]